MNTPAMITLPAALLFAAGLACGQTPLTPAQVAGGWRPMLTASSAPGLRAYKQPGFPAKGWSVADGILTSAKGGGGGDLVTSDEFGDFEFAFDFRCTPKANSGVMYRVAETLD
ncbi:MAG: 3-keto-disaccharide hydrolase, partial [Phycisphaerales bacterium]